MHIDTGQSLLSSLAVAKNQVKLNQLNGLADYPVCLKKVILGSSSWPIETDP
jgi:hypothetical protein